MLLSTLIKEAFYSSQWLWVHKIMTISVLKISDGQVMSLKKDMTLWKKDRKNVGDGR